MKLPPVLAGPKRAASLYQESVCISRAFKTIWSLSAAILSNLNPVAEDMLEYWHLTRRLGSGDVLSVTTVVLGQS